MDAELEMGGETADDLDLDEIYIDQSMHHGFVSSAYTSYGLRKLEGWMIRQICDGSIYPFVELEAMITHNIHYHRIVKENLLLNLRNYAAMEKQLDRPPERV